MRHLKQILISILCVFLLAGICSSEPATPFIQSFSGGELSPKLDARTDLEKYYSGSRTLENMIPLVEGPVTRAPGTYFALETKDSSKASRLIPFQFSTIQAYVLEVGDLYIRVYKDDGQVNTVDANTVLLLHADGTDASTTFTDSGTTGHTVTANADAQIDTAQKKFGTGAGLFDGAGDYLSMADHADWYMGTDPFTIDFWVRAPSSVSGSTAFFQQRVDADNQVLCNWNFSGALLRFYIYDGASEDVALSAAVSYNADTWYHVAIIRGWGGNANDWALCWNGVAVDTDTSNASDWPNLAAEFHIGRHNITYHEGHIEEFRVSKGIARWTSNFTPPTQEYPFIDTGVLTGGGGTALEITTTYSADDVFDIKTVQSADYLYLFHPDYPPKTLTRSSHTSWTFTDFQAKIGSSDTITNITQADPAVVTGTTIPATLAEGDIIYISGVSGMTEVNNLFFTAGTVVTGAGGTVELSGIDSTGYTAYTSGGTVQETMFGTTDNNPSCGTFFEQRLAMGGTNDNPQTFAASVSADYEDFTTGADDDDAMEYTLVSDKVDRIRWMMGYDYLMIGTVGGLWKVGASTASDPMTPTNITAKRQATIGVKNISPEIVSDALLWVTRAGTSVRQFVYAFEVDKWVIPDMTRIAGHIAIGSSLANSGIDQLAFQREPLPILWGIRADGQLLGMTYEVQEKVYSWFRIVTDGDFESVAVISREDNEDQVWVIVQRTINGSDVRYVEYFKNIEFYGQIEDAFFVHSGLTYEDESEVLATYTEVDPNSRISLASNVLTFTNVPGNEDSYLYKDFTADFFDEDFIHKTHIKITAASATNAVAYLWTMTNTVDNPYDLKTGNDDLLAVYFFRSAGPVYNLYMEESNAGSITNDSSSALALNTDYYLTITRDESVGTYGTLYCYIYSDSDRSTLVDTLTITLTENEDFRYLYAFTSYDWTDTPTMSGEVSDLMVSEVTLSGLDHLEGEAVSVLADGVVVTGKTVSSGSITLDDPAKKVHVGLPYTSIVEPMKLNAGHELGTARGKKQRIHKIVAAFYQTGDGVQFGPSQSNLKDFTGLTSGSLTTDDLAERFHGTYSDEATISIVQEEPLPMTILGIVPWVTLNED